MNVEVNQAILAWSIRPTNDTNTHNNNNNNIRPTTNNNTHECGTRGLKFLDNSFTFFTVILGDLEGVG